MIEGRRGFDTWVWQEFFADYFAIDPYHFTLNLPSNYLCMLPTVLDPQNSQLACDRIVEGIAAVFLSMKRRPAIRYQRSSEISKRVAQDAAVGAINYQSIFLDYDLDYLDLPKA